MNSVICLICFAQKPYSQCEFVRYGDDQQARLICSDCADMIPSQDSAQT